MFTPGRPPILATTPILAASPILDLIRRRQLLLLRPETRPLTPSTGPILRLCALITNNTTADLTRFRRDVELANATWAPCNIRFTEGALTRIHAGGDYPDWAPGSPLPDELLRQRGSCRPTDIKLYYVHSIAGSTTQSRSGSIPGEPGYIALANDASPSLFLLELGRLLGVFGPDGAPLTDMGIGPDQCTRALATVRGERFTSGGGYSSPGAPPLTPLGQATAQWTLMGALHDPAPIVRAAALQALATMGPRS